MSLRRFLFAAAVVAAMIPLAAPSPGLASSPTAAPTTKASAKPGKPKKLAHKPMMVKSAMSRCMKNCANSANGLNGQAPSHI
jgi:hypothetical protein